MFVILKIKNDKHSYLETSMLKLVQVRFYVAYSSTLSIASITKVSLSFKTKIYSSRDDLDYLKDNAVDPYYLVTEIIIFFCI